jgi:uncharacterized protein (TIRG00374 family)
MSARATADAIPRRGKPRRPRWLDWRALVGIAISVILLWWTFRNEDLIEIFREIGRADPLLFGLATFVATFIFWIRAWRWKALVDPVHRNTSFHSRFAAVSIGFMGNNLLPARIGEFARAYAFSRIEPVPLVASFSTLVIERLFDAVFIVISLFVAMALPDFPDVVAARGFINGARTLAVLVLAAFIILFLLVMWPQRTVGAIEKVANRALPARFCRPVVDALEAFLKGVSVLRDPILLMRASWWTLVLWLVNAFGFWLAFRAFGLDLTFTAALFLQAAIALFVSVPSGPGFFGLYEAAAKLVLIDLWGQAETASLAFAAGFHLAGFIPITLIGLYYARKIGMSLRAVADTEEAVEEAVEEQMQHTDAKH